MEFSHDRTVSEFSASLTFYSLLFEHRGEKSLGVKSHTYILGTSEKMYL